MIKNSNGVKKILLFFVLVLLAVIIGGCVNQKSTVFDTGNIDNRRSSFQSKSKSIDGVEVTVKDIKKENNKIIVELYLSNHQYDLSKMAVKKMSNLAGVQPSDYEIKNSAMGGHHVEAELVFAGELSGRLVVGLNKELIFNFDI